jgi:hypothetical protein
LLLWPALGHTDEVVVRGNYYRDRNTRVLQPQVDLNKEFPTGTTVGASYLLDAITSASVAAGVQRDEPFTEVRNEFGLRLGQRLGPALLSGGYSYSTESDYQAHSAFLSGVVDLFQRNTTLGLALAYGHDNVHRRMGPTSYSTLGTLDRLNLIATWTQVLTARTLLTVSYDLGVHGFGSKDNGFQANPYRTVMLGGSPNPEQLPFQRIRHALAASLYLHLPLPSKTVRYLAFRPSYRFYIDDWSIVSHTPELRIYLAAGPVELRLTGRYYAQGRASFWNDIGDGRPVYMGNVGKPCTSCTTDSARGMFFHTADPKLSQMSSLFLELRLLIDLGFMRKVSSWLSEGRIEASYGHMFNDRWANITWGDAEVAGLTFVFPL